MLWILVPFVTLEIYPLKGYQYLLPVAPAVALLAARALTTWHLPARLDKYTKSVLRPVVIAVVLVSLLPGVWSVMFPSVSAVGAGRAGRAWPVDGRPASGSGPTWCRAPSS